MGYELGAIPQHQLGSNLRSQSGAGCEEGQWDCSP